VRSGGAGGERECGGGGTVVDRTPPDYLMINTVLTKIIGTKNERELKAIRPLIQRINTLEPSIAGLSDDDLRAKTAEFRRRLGGGSGGDGGGGGGTLDTLLPEAFAAVPEAGRR